MSFEQTGDRHLLERMTRVLGAERRRGHVRIGGSVTQASPTHYQVAGLSRHVRLGECVEFEADGRKALAQVVRVDADAVTIETFETGTSLGLGHPVWRRGPLVVSPAESWKGRIIDALARPIDRKGPLEPGAEERNTEAAPPDPMTRQRVRRPLTTSVKVIDIFTPICAGQRIGIFAGSGVGKSTLLGMLTRSHSFDSTVVALVGERGREVREFVEDILADALARTVVVVATGDESPMMRRQAPRTAMAVAEFLRDRGENVLLIFDSITRYAHALREVALAAGEPPVARGYAPSVFTELPRLLERAGPGSRNEGTITGVFSVLVDGDDHNEPVADTVRGILDGHIVLDREVASRGQFPAVDILASVSRLADIAWTDDQRRIAKTLKALISTFESTRELRLLGAYKPNTNTQLDRAVTVVPRIYEIMTQTPNAPVKPDTFQELARILGSPGEPSI